MWGWNEDSPKCVRCACTVGFVSSIDTETAPKGPLPPEIRSVRPNHCPAQVNSRIGARFLNRPSRVGISSACTSVPWRHLGMAQQVLSQRFRPPF